MRFAYLGVALLAVGCFGQTWRGVIGGVVVDASDARIPNAAVSILEEETGRTREIATGASGDFSATGLTPGTYRIEVERAGFRTAVRTVVLNVNQDVRVEIRMQAGDQADQISVTAQAELLKTQVPQLSTVVDTRALRQLPLDGRNFYELSLLAPGTLPAAQGSAGSVRGDFAIHVNGAREDANQFLLDGIYNGDSKLNGAGVSPPPDAIREFEVLTHTYDASFGRNAGGQINVVLQSGSNQLHGTVWEFFRNAALDARNAFAPADEAAPRYQRNQFGVSIGGPVRKNRTFFFGDYEGTRRREGRTLITNVPTVAERTGDFSQSAAPPMNLQTGQPLLFLPPAFQHPVGRAIVNLYPLPNRNVPGQNYISSPVERDTVHHFDTRLDHSFGAGSDFALRYSCADRTLFEPFATGYSRLPGFGNDVERRAQNVMASETHVFTPSFLNEARLGFNRVAIGVTQQNADVSLNRQIGLPEVWSNSRAQGLSYISLPGYSPLGQEYNSPQHSVINTYQIVDQASYTSARHQIKFGGDIRILQQNGFRDIQSRGLLSFFGITGSPVADALLGIPTVSAFAQMDNHQNLRSESYSLFVHDTVRLTPALTVSAGLRYELTSPAVDIRDRSQVYDVATGTLAQVGTNGIPRAGYRTDRNNFAPRLGIAWAPGPGGFVARAAYGIFYDQAALAPSESLYFSPPYWDFRLFVPLGNQLLSLSDPFPSNYPFRLPSSAFGLQRDLRSPYLQHWNFNVQQGIGRHGVAEIAYVGTKGTGLIAGRDINQPQPTPGAQYFRPNPRFEDVTMLESRANSIYHSMQARYQQRLTSGLSTLLSYTFGKSIDDASNFFPSAGDPNFPQNSYDLRAERARSGFDVRHRASLSYVYDLPLRGNLLLSGWQTNGVWSFQTGRPFTVALLPDIDNSNTGRTSLGFGANDRPNVVGSAGLDNPSASRWFNPAAFAMPARGTFGNAGRNTVEGPGFQSINVSLVKNTPISDRTTIQFRAEAFNLLNRTNYDQPDNYFGSPSFGSVLSAGQPRRLQFGLRFLF